MSKFIKYDSTLTDVTAFSGNFDNRELSARPEFTQTLDLYDVTLATGFSGTQGFEGYNFDSVQGVMLSTVDGAQLFDTDSYNSTVTMTNSTAGVSSLSYLSGGATIDPPISGYFLSTGTSAGTYTLNNYNSMSVAFPTASASGILDIIPINAAGFTTLATDLQTTITIT